MKNLKYSLLALLAIMGMASCSNDYEYTPADPADNVWTYPYQAYFPQSTLNKTTVQLASDATSYDIVVERDSTVGALTLAIEFSQGAESTTQISVPESVTFADGENQAVITVTYNPSTIEYDDPNADTLRISTDSDIYMSPATSQYLFTTVLPSPWTSLGTGKFMDAFIYDDETYFDVEIQQNDLDHDLFRIVNPYQKMLEDGGYYEEGFVNEGPAEFFEFHLLRKGWSLLDVEATQNDYVYWNSLRTGYHIPDYDDGESTDGEVYAVFPGLFTSLQSEEAWQFNKVLEYQADGTTPGEIELAPYYYIFGVGGWNYTQKEGTIRILFPGFEKKDFTVSAIYAGIFKNTAEESQAVVDFTLGEDVASAKYALTEASVSEAEAAAAIAAGELEAEEITKDGRVYIPLEEDGKYRVTIVSFNSDGEAKESASAVFEFTKGESPWESLGMGLYTEDLMTSFYNVENQTYEVEILASTQTPGLYRLKNPYGAAYPYNEEGDWDPSMDYYLEINAEDPTSVYIEEQEMGLDWNNGVLSVVSEGAYYMAQYPDYGIEVLKANGIEFGTLENGVITFPEKTIYAKIGSSLRYGNTNGAFKVVLPEAREVKPFKAPAKKKVSHRITRQTKAVKVQNIKTKPTATKVKPVVTGRIAKIMK